MIFGTHVDTITKDPDLIRMMLKTASAGVEFMSANTPAVVDMSVQKLGANRAAVEQALGRKERRLCLEARRHRADPGQDLRPAHARPEAESGALPKFETFLNPKFSNELASA